MTLSSFTGIDALPGVARRGAAILHPASDPVGDEVTLDPVLLAANGIFGFALTDVRSRSFLLLRAQLLNHFHRDGGRILAVTSAQPGNGKTYVAANLAAALGCIHPTVLIDLDLRRPSLASRFGLSPGVGVDDYLAGEALPAHTATRIASSDLVIHGVRRSRPDPASLLKGDRLAQLIDSVRQRADAPICIIDTPPVQVVDDIVLIARNVDGILIVIEEGATRAADLIETLRTISPTPIIGSVLNKSLTGERLRASYEDYYRPRSHD